MGGGRARGGTRGRARGRAPRARRARKRVTFDDGENERENERDVSTADAGRENPHDERWVRSNRARARRPPVCAVARLRRRGRLDVHERTRARFRRTRASIATRTRVFPCVRAVAIRAPAPRGSDGASSSRRCSRRARREACSSATTRARACGSCAIDVSFVTEPLLRDDVEENGNGFFIGGFELSSARADALSSWQVTWSLRRGPRNFRGNVSDGILINPGGPNGQPARVVNQLNANGGVGRSFSFIGRVVDGYESSNVVARDVTVSGLACASPLYAGNEAVRFVDIDCVRREYRFCCGSQLAPPPPPPPPPPFLPPHPRVGRDGVRRARGGVERRGVVEK